MDNAPLDRWTRAQRAIKYAKRQLEFPSWLDPEDIEQEMICIALEYINSKPENEIRTQYTTRFIVSKMKKWVASCVRERHTSMSAEEITQHWYSSTVDNMAHQYITDIVHERLTTLSKCKYNVMHMLVFDGMTSPQISEKLGTSRQYAHELANQGIRYLRYPPRARPLKACLMYYDSRADVDDLVDTFVDTL